MKWPLPLVLAISMLGCVQVDQGAQKTAVPDLLLGEWVSARMFMDAQEPTHLKFLPNGRVERTEKGKELRNYTYARQPFDQWAMKEGSAKSIGSAPDDPPLQEIFAGATEVVTLTPVGDPAQTEPALLLFLQANRSMTGFRPGSDRLSLEALFIRLEDLQQADAEMRRPDDFSSAILLKADFPGERRVMRFDLRTSLEVENSFLRVDLLLRDNFNSRVDKKEKRALLHIGDSARIFASLVELGEEGAANLRGGYKLGHDEYKTPVTEKNVVIESIRIKTAEGWTGYLETMDRDKSGSSLRYTMFRGKEYFVTDVSATVPSTAIRKDADLFVATLSKELGKRSGPIKLNR